MVSVCELRSMSIDPLYTTRLRTSILDAALFIVHVCGDRFHRITVSSQ